MVPLDNQTPTNNKPMKKTLLTMTLAAIHLAAFAQGKVTFGNGPTHLIVFTSDSFQLPAQYAPYAGLPVPQMGTPNGQLQYFTAQLLAGTSSTSLSLQSTLTPAGFTGFADGRMGSQTVTLSGVPAGTAFFQVIIWETAGGSYANATVRGESPVFQTTAGSFAPTPIDSASGWAAGPIVLTAVPEPSIYALAALGAASLLLFRGRK